MKTVILEIPDDVNIVCANFISTALFNTWVINSSFKPNDGLRVIVHDAPDKDCAGKVEYVEAEK